MSDYILEMNHIVKEFSGVRALDDVNLKVRRGRSEEHTSELQSQR